MNERIKELVKKAGLDDPMCPIDEWDNPELEKFAELIVRECASIDFYKLAHIGTEDDYNVTQVIKEHFGVSE
jgi:hypothetical protein